MEELQKIYIVEERSVRSGELINYFMFSSNEKALECIVILQRELGNDNFGWDIHERFIDDMECIL